MKNSKEYNHNYYLKYCDIILEKRKECKYCGLCMEFYPRDYFNKHLLTRKHNRRSRA